MYHTILVPIDLNEKGFSDKAIEAALWHVKHSQAKLHLLNVMPGVHMSMVASYFPQDAMQRMKQDSQAQLNAFANKYIPKDVSYQLHVDEGRPYTTILDYAKKIQADLIIMPSHKQSKMDKVILGSVASKVVEHSPISVLVIKPQG